MSLRLPQEFVDRLRSAVDLVEVVSAHSKLRKTGNSWKGLCPFHSERTPSFTVSPERQVFYCFGCGKGGNLFTFVMEVEKLSFVDAARMLAEKAGIAWPEMERVEGAEPSRTRRLLELHAFAHRYYRERLRSAAGAPARDYLIRRGIPEEAAERFGLGYATAEWDGLLRAAQENGFSAELLEEGGLSSRRQSGEGHYDRFRARLIFPIADAAGKVIAFGGRILADDPEAPKYLNSPETPLYRKGHGLYALHLAREAIHKVGRVIVVEGYVDALTMHVHGFAETVAALGTSLTEQQVALLTRYAHQVVLVFDGDRAGLAAALRGTDLVAGTGLSSRVAVLEEGGKDPDEFLRNRGADAMRARLDSARELFDYRVDFMVHETGTADPQAKLRVARDLLGWFGRLTSPLEQSLYLQRLSERLALNEDALRAELKIARPNPSRGRRLPEPAPISGNVSRGGVESLEEEVVSWLLQADAPKPGSAGMLAGDFASPGLRALVDTLEQGSEPEDAAVAALRARLILLPRLFPNLTAAVGEFVRARGRLRDADRMNELRAALAKEPANVAVPLLAEYQELARKLKASPTQTAV